MEYHLAGSEIMLLKQWLMLGVNEVFFYLFISCSYEAHAKTQVAYKVNRRESVAYIRYSNAYRWLVFPPLRL
jgi:hypothetical protein